MTETTNNCATANTSNNNKNNKNNDSSADSATTTIVAQTSDLDPVRLKQLEDQEFIYHRNANGSDITDNNQASLFMEFLRQLRPGMDLYRIAVPPSVLEPRSMLERLSCYACPSSLILNVSLMKSPEQRLLSVLRYIIAMFGTIPKQGIMSSKPYNPVLGEEFKCKWDHGGNNFTVFVAEQVSHHPPVSAFHMENRKKNIIFHGTLTPKSKFHGNSLSSIMDGSLVFRILNYGEEYDMVFPHVVARGVLFGNQCLELTNKLKIQCTQSGYKASVLFKSKSNNELEGKVKKGSELIYTLSGCTDTQIMIKNVQKERDIVFLDRKDMVEPPKLVEPVARQHKLESRRVWHDLSYGLITKDYDVATKAKVAVEEAQRAIAKERSQSGQQWSPKNFVMVAGDEWQHKNFRPTPYKPDGVDEERDPSNLV